MARTENRVELIGHVGKNPNIHYTAGTGAIIANFSLATNSPFKNSKGEWEQRPEWHSLVTFKRNAELVRDYVKQGVRIRVVGRLQTRDWDDRETGRKVYKTEIVVNDIMFLSAREEPASAVGPAPASYQPPANHPIQDSTPEYSDAEIAEYSDSDPVPF